MKRLSLYPLGALCVLILVAAQPKDPCCLIVSLDEKRQAITAVDRETGDLFTFTVRDPAVFRSAGLGETFDAELPAAEDPAMGAARSGTETAVPFGADFGVAEPGEPCCGLTAAPGTAGKVLGVGEHEAAGVHVVLTELARTAGNTVTAKWEYYNGSEEPLRFEQQGCVGMGCTYTVAEEAHLLDGATRTKHDVLRDMHNKALAQRYEGANLGVAPHEVFRTWAKFEAPPASSSVITVVIPGVIEPFEDVPIAP